MQTRVSRILFSNILWNFSHLPKAPILEKSPTAGLLSSLRVARFSTIPNRPLRGDRRRDDVGSEELFLRNLNFGDDKEQEKGEETHQNSPPRLPNRPLRREQRPMRGEDLEKGSPLYQNLKDSGSLRQKERPFFANRSKEEEKIDESFGIGDQVNREKEGDQLGDTLFEKLNLGDIGVGKKPKEPHQNPSTGTHSSVPESPPEDADEIFKKMKETGLIPNAVAMLDGLCKDGLVQEAMKLFGLMREKGTIPEVVIYTAVVEGFCKAAKFDDAKRIFRKMQKNGIIPNAFSYTVIIQGLCKGNKLEDAVEFCMEMIETNHSLNAATLTGLVDGFCKTKGVEEAESVVRSLRERGFAMDEKAVREHLDKKGPHSPMVWEAIFGKKNSQRAF